MKIKPSKNGEITLSFTDIGKSCQRRELLTLQICLLTLFAEIKLFTVTGRIYPDFHFTCYTIGSSNL